MMADYSCHIAAQAHKTIGRVKQNNIELSSSGNKKSVTSVSQSTFECWSLKANVNILILSTVHFL